MTDTSARVPFTYSPIAGRSPIVWPGGAKVAVYVGLNIEHFHVDKPSTSLVEATAGLIPDALNYGWRDYGSRVGIWRIMSILDRHSVRASALVNSEVTAHYPQIVEAGLERGWAWVAHGRTNSIVHTGFDEEVERRELAETVATIERATGRRPLGWMGPALSETFATPQLLAELGLSYTLDWTNDDQPYWLTQPGMMSVPYSVEINDLGIFTMHGMSGPQFEQMLADHLDQLLADDPVGRVMGIALHPFVIGQPSRAKYLDRALERIAARDDVWLTTSDEIADHFASTHVEALGHDTVGR